MQQRGNRSANDAFDRLVAAVAAALGADIEHPEGGGQVVTMARAQPHHPGVVTYPPAG